MSEPTIICPSCKTPIRITESLAAPLVESARKDFESKLAQKEQDISKREATLRQAQAAVDEQVASKLKMERQTIAAEEAKKARTALETDIAGKDRLVADLNETVKSLNAKLTTAQKVEADSLRKQREFEDAKREMDLTIEKRVQESLSAVESKARDRVQEEIRLKMAEKDKLIADAQKQVEEMKRKMEQGSQQLQGEVQELELETILRARFPRDTIEPVPKGEYGGDAVQRILGPTGSTCGTILWESKRVKNWSDGWLSKLRDDQRTAHADFAVLVTQALPKGLETFDLMDGVWVTSFKCALPVAMALRHSLIELSMARQSREGQQTKMEMVYQYLTGPRFRHRVQAIVEKFSDMQEDLDKERKTMTRLWAKREEQIRGVIESTAGMYGDLQGIAGRSLQEIAGLQMETLELGPTDVSADPKTPSA